MLPQNNPDRIRIVFDDHRLVANAGHPRPSPGPAGTRRPSPRPRQRAGAGEHREQDADAGRLSAGGRTLPRRLQKNPTKNSRTANAVSSCSCNAATPTNLLPSVITSVVHDHAAPVAHYLGALDTTLRQTPSTGDSPPGTPELISTASTHAILDLTQH